MEKIAAILLVVGLVAGVAGGYGGAFVTSINSLQSENQDLNSKLSTSQSELSTSQSELSNTQSQLTKSQSDLTAEQSKTTGLDTKISNANEMIEGLEAKVAATQKSLEEADDKLTELQGGLSLFGTNTGGILEVTVFVIVFSLEDGEWGGTGYLTITDTRDNKVVIFNYFILDTLEKSGDEITLTGEIINANDSDRYLGTSVVIVATDSGDGVNETIIVNFPTAKPPANNLSVTGFIEFCEPGECEE